MALKDIRLTRAEFEALRAAGELPFGQLPVLDRGIEPRSMGGAAQHGRPVGSTDLPSGERVACQGAILRLVGKWGGLYPSDAVEACRVDMLMDLEGDLMLPMLLTVYPARLGLPVLSNPQELAAQRRALLTPGAPVERRLVQLEAALTRFGFGERDRDPWAAGTLHPTIADCVLVPRLVYLASGELEGVPPDVLEPYPKVVALVARFRRLVETLVRRAEDWRCQICTHTTRPSSDTCEVCGFPGGAPVIPKLPLEALRV